jgi:hypothetical protein
MVQRRPQACVEVLEVGKDWNRFLGRHLGNGGMVLIQVRFAIDP